MTRDWLTNLPTLFGYGTQPWMFYLDSALLVLLAYVIVCVITGKKF